MAQRSRTRRARQRRKQQRRRSKRLLILAALVAAAVVGVAVIIVSNQPVEAFIPEALSDRYAGIARSNSPEGYPRLGDPDAPVTLEEYASFACPGCESLHKNSFDALLERVRGGQVLFTYVPLNTGSIPNAAGASRAALCAGRENMFWEMHDLLFDWQTRYGNTAFSQNRLLAGVEGLGLSSDAFTACFNSAGISATLAAAVEEGLSTTPTLRVNGVTIDAGATGGIPNSTTILQAIDAATPDDWSLPAEAPAPDPEPPPETEETEETESDAESAEGEAAPTEAEAETAPPASDDSAESETAPATDDSEAAPDESAEDAVDAEG